MDNRVISLRCPSCGSTDIVMESEKIASCKSCGSKFAVAEDKGERNVYVTNEVHIGAGSKVANHVNRTYNDVVDAVTVMRNVFIDLADDPNSPEDIFDSEFGTVIREIDQYLCVIYDVNVAYSASVGYDRRETYYERGSDGNLKEKTRTVTDWRPVSGQKIFTEGASYVLKTNGDPDEQRSRFRTLLKTADESIPFEQGNVDVKPIVPTDEVYYAARGNAESQAESECRDSLPGDHVRDFRASSVSELKISAVYVVPDYVLPYKYKGAEYSSREYACSTTVAKSKRPSDEANKKKNVSAKLRPIAVPALLMPLALLIAAIVLLVTDPAVEVRVGVIVALYVVSIALVIVSLIRSKLLLSDYMGYLQRIKTEGLEKLLARKSLPGLTDSERASIMDIKAKSKSAKFKSALNVLAVIALICGIIVGIIAMV